MDTKETTQAYRLSQWAELIRERGSCGKTIKMWCIENNISENAYYYWLKRVREAACESLAKQNPGNIQIVPVKLSDQKIETNLESADPSVGITLRFGSISLEFHNGASVGLIENTLRALHNVG